MDVVVVEVKVVLLVAIIDGGSGCVDVGSGMRGDGAGSCIGDSMVLWLNWWW